MKEYTYSELAAMQEEAKQRVMEMQRKSKYAVEDMNRAFAQNTKTENTSGEEQRGKCFSHCSIPVAQQPRNIQYPTGIVNRENEKHKAVCESNTAAVCMNNKNTKQTNAKNDTVTRFANVFGKLSREESEKMLILALCLLLSDEQTDENLIMALLYLIA